MRVAVSLALAAALVAFGVFVVRRVWIAWKEAGSRWGGGTHERPSVGSPSEDLGEGVQHDPERNGEPVDREGRS